MGSWDADRRPGTGAGGALAGDRRGETYISGTFAGLDISSNKLLGQQFPLPPPQPKLVGSRSKHKVKVRAVDLHIIGGLRTSGFLKLPKLVAWGLTEAFLCRSDLITRISRQNPDVYCPKVPRPCFLAGFKRQPCG